jgi:hypothetical protein
MRVLIAAVGILGFVILQPASASVVRLVHHAAVTKIGIEPFGHPIVTAGTLLCDVA